MDTIKSQYEWVASETKLSSTSQGCHGQANSLDLVHKRTRSLFGYGPKIDPQLYVCKKIFCGTLHRARNAEREYQILKQLQHPHILAYADFAYMSQHSIATLYTEYCSNGDLGLFLPGKRMTQKFTEQYALDVARQISLALVYLHDGVTVLIDKDGVYSKLELAERCNDLMGENRWSIYVHRDIKPENSKS